MFTYRFVWDEKLSILDLEVDAPYELLGRYFNLDVMNAGGAEDVLDLLQPVLDGRLAHFSGAGHMWWLEVGPTTTRIGHIFASPPLELEVPTRPFIELHAIYRDEKRADAARRRASR